MAVEAINAGKLVAEQKQAIAGFFGAEVPMPSDRVFEVAEKISEEQLLANPLVIYLPRRQMAEGLDLPGQHHKLSPYLYQLMRNGLVAKDADCLPGIWAIIDTTKRPSYDGDRQMYPDTSRFKEIMSNLRAQGKIEAPYEYKHVPTPSRFAVSPEEIDGRGGFVAKAVADILGLRDEEPVTTLPGVVFNYVGNLYPKLGFGSVNTSEWLRDSVGRGDRLFGGDSGYGGLSFVNDWQSGNRGDNIGFRLQISFPAKA